MDFDWFAQQLPGWREWVMLRQAHALEHATVWVLNEMQAQTVSTSRWDDGNLGGLATDRGFYLYGTVEVPQLNRAARCALRRLQQGDWQLALHPRCGTNTLVSLVVAASLTLGTSVLLPRSPLAQLVGMGTALTLATQLAPELGSWTQQHLTTEIPFNLQVARVFPTVDLWGRTAHFVQVEWCDSARLKFAS
ncbi:MAG: hypothetical protein F6J87_05060 [Spirulina sp. SIO3F2]|nr:hypothetical protein [Spirulina sp. SIO3F2]